MTKANQPYKSPILLEFWQRQIDSNPTTPQLAFDLVFGVVVPVSLISLDRWIFTGNWQGAGVLEFARISAYTLMVLEILTLIIWLIARSRIESYSGLLGGALIIGALSSLVVGFIAQVTIGLLLFLCLPINFLILLIPAVFARNGIRAVRCALEQNNSSLQVVSIFVGAIITVVIPLIVQLLFAK